MSRSHKSLIATLHEIGVVHLVRAQNGIEPFKHFLESYRQNHGGVKHDLIVVMKGFDQKYNMDYHLELLASFKHIIVEVPDIGYDIMVYFAIAKRYANQYQYFCFLNSFSEILDHNWLSKLYMYISQPNIGLVGATGSWESHGNIQTWLNAITVGLSHYSTHKDKVFWKRIIIGTVGIWNHCRTLMCFKLFPNYHIRSNAFMIPSELINSLKCPIMKTKMDAYKFESGKMGMTMQILKLKKNVFVVGKDGLGYEKKVWNKSKTFWQAEQENLLVADNQTRNYQFGDLERRKYLSCCAWGTSCNNKSYGARE